MIRNMSRMMAAVGLPALLALSHPAWAQDKGDDPSASKDEKGDPPSRVGPPAGMPGPMGNPMPGGPMGPMGGPVPGGPMSQPGEDVPPVGPDAGNGSSAPPVTKKVPCVAPTSKVTIDFVDAPLMDVAKYMAEITCKNFILGKDLEGQVTIISHQEVTVPEAYEAFLSALEVAGYTTVTVGGSTKIVSTSKAANAPLRVYEGDNIPGTDNFVTQIIELDNVSVTDISTVVKELSGPSAKVIAYAPTNTLIVTDAAYNIRRVYRIIKQMDVAAPKSHIEVIAIKFATAAEVETILEEVYGVAASSSGSSASSSSSNAADRSSRRRRNREEAAPEATGATATSVGAEGAFISKIISDERTNSIILLANDEAIAKVKELIAQVDVDIDPASRSQIHVIYLDYANAEDISNVLSNLSNGSSGGGSRSSGGSSRTGQQNRGGNTQNRNNQNRGNTGGGGGNFNPGGAGGGFGGGGGLKPYEPGGAAGESTGVAAAFDSGTVRITADENTNSLVILASPEDFKIIKNVIDKLDIPRRQVYVEAVVVEVGSEDELDLGIGYHVGNQVGENGISYGSAQMNASSLGLSSADLLSGLAMGVLGQAIPVTLSDGTSLNVPAFGIALNALSSNSAVNILSNPNILVLDNEEASINVGRNVPFPVSAGRDNNGQPIVSYQREDVGITLEVTPQINESNTVTLEMSLEVAEVEEDSSGLDVSTAGFITSKRETTNVVVVDDNQTIVIGGLIGNTQTEVETKIPVLGDIPLIGVLFRGKRNTERKTNLLIFLTPHVINETTDLEEVYRIKMAQREEFLRRFYGKSREAKEAEMQALLAGSMNIIDQPSVYRKKEKPSTTNEGTIESGTTTPAGGGGGFGTGGTGDTDGGTSGGGEL